MWPRRAQKPDETVHATAPGFFNGNICLQPRPRYDEHGYRYGAASQSSIDYVIGCISSPIDEKCPELKFESDICFPFQQLPSSMKGCIFSLKYSFHFAYPIAINKNPMRKVTSKSSSIQGSTNHKIQINNIEPSSSHWVVHESNLIESHCIPITLPVALAKNESLCSAGASMSLPHSNQLCL